MGSIVMQEFWQSGVILVGIMLLMTVGAVILWTSCLLRVCMVLFPAYGIDGIKTLFFTHPSTEGNYGVLISAYCLENTIGICMAFMSILLIYQVLRTCHTEKNYVLRERPNTVAQFCVLALKHLDDDDFSKLTHQQLPVQTSVHKSKPNQLSKRNTIKMRKHASERVALMFKNLGYCVGRVLDEDQEDEDLGIKDEYECKARADMQHFIAECKHLNWDQIREENTLSFRESACLHRLHEELYGATS